MTSRKTTKGIPIYNDSDVINAKSDFNGAMKKIDELLTGSGAVSSVNGKTGVVVLKAEDIEDSAGNTLEDDIAELESVIIGASATETIKGFVVPKLTNEEITQAHNGIVAGKKVIIVDSLNTLNMSVYSANNISGNIVINAIFNDTLILTYKEGETTPTISASLIGELDKDVWTFTLDDGTSVNKNVALYQ